MTSYETAMGEIHKCHAAEQHVPSARHTPDECPWATTTPKETNMTIEAITDNLNLHAVHAEENVPAARENLARAVAEGVRAEELNRHLHSLAGAEEVAQYTARALRCWNFYTDKAQAVVELWKFCTTTLTRGADDCWSGRSNDLRRAAHDALRDAVEATVNQLETL